MTDTYWTRNRRRTSKAFNKHIGVFASAMKKYPRKIGEEQFIAESRRKYDELLPRLPVLAGSKHHIFNELMPALGAISAAFTVLRSHGYSVEQIGRLEYEGYLQYFSKFPRPVRRLMGRVMVSPLFPAFLKRTCRKMVESGRDDTFYIEYSFEKKPQPATRVNCTRCAMITFMERNRLEEMKPLCNVFDFAQGAAAGFGLRQPTCIGAGDDTCSYVFTRDSSQTVLPTTLAAMMHTPMDASTEAPPPM